MNLRFCASFLAFATHGVYGGIPEISDIYRMVDQHAVQIAMQNALRARFPELGRHCRRRLLYTLF